MERPFRQDIHQFSRSYHHAAAWVFQGLAGRIARAASRICLGMTTKIDHLSEILKPGVRSEAAGEDLEGIGGMPKEGSGRQSVCNSGTWELTQDSFPFMAGGGDPGPGRDCKA